MLSDWAEIVSARRESWGEGMKKGGITTGRLFFSYEILFVYVLICPRSFYAYVVFLEISVPCHHGNHFHV